MGTYREEEEQEKGVMKPQEEEEEEEEQKEIWYRPWKEKREGNTTERGQGLKVT